MESWGINMKTTILMTVFMIVAAVLAYSVNGFSIESPVHTAYNTSDVMLSIVHNETLDNITYTIDSGSNNLACENCSNFTTTLNLTEGNHTVAASGMLGNDSFSTNVDFSIVFPVSETENNTDNNTTNETNATQDFSLSIGSPTSQTYTTHLIWVSLMTNTTVDNMSYSVDGGLSILACSNCSVYNTTLTMSDGMHMLNASATWMDLTKWASVSFNVNTTVTQNNTNMTNQTNTTGNTTGNNTGNNTGNQSMNRTGPRFSLGFEKLPQAVEAGNISDSELAQIIRNNSLNPGILNRLIKTGKLGNESINAIIDTQKTPWGIFKKIFNWLGVKQESYSSLIYDNYQLSDDQEKKLANREDLPQGYKKNIEKKEQQKTNDGNSISRGNSDNPGKGNKGSTYTGENADTQDEKTPRGQAMKENDPGKGKGKDK
jgi:hypothetical protein